MRRTTSETNTSAASTGTGTGSAVGTRVPPRREVAPAEEVAEGEWAEVLYDYSSEVRRERRGDTY